MASAGQNKQVILLLPAIILRLGTRLCLFLSERSNIISALGVMVQGIAVFNDPGAEEVPTDFASALLSHVQGVTSVLVSICPGSDQQG